MIPCDQTTVILILTENVDLRLVRVTCSPTLVACGHLSRDKVSVSTSWSRDLILIVSVSSWSRLEHNFKRLGPASVSSSKVSFTS